MISPIFIVRLIIKVGIIGAVSVIGYTESILVAFLLTCT
jgi:hypothetical protein